MKLKTDYRKLKAVIFLGLSLCVASIFAVSGIDGSGQLIWTSFLLSSGLLFLVIGLIKKSRFVLTSDYLEAKDLMGLSKRKILLIDIKKVKFIHKDFPASAHIQNPLWLILWDKKFKKIKQLELYNISERIFSIDGHLIDDNDFEWLQKRLRKPDLKRTKQCLN